MEAIFLIVIVAAALIIVGRSILGRGDRRPPQDPPSKTDTREGRGPRHPQA